MNEHNASSTRQKQEVFLRFGIMGESAQEISSILMHLLEEQQISESELGRKTNIPRATINRITSGRTPDPRASTLQAIAEYFKVSVDQLMGRQPLFRATRNQRAINAYASLPIIEWDEVADWSATLKKIKPKNHLNWVLSDPNIAQGKFGTTLKSEAMWPQFQEDSILIVQPDQKPKDGDFVLAMISKTKEVLFREISIDGRYKFLKPLNAIYPTIEMKRSDKIIGIVIQSRINMT
jgi:transcriptional regulator with XRE-family HTH domain